MRAAVSILAALLLVAAFPARVPTAPQADAAFEQLATLVKQKMAEHSVPGVAFGVLKNGQLTMRGFGVTNVDDQLPLTGNTQQLVRGDLTVASPVTLNEPVTLSLSLKNGSPYPLQVDLGFDREGAFEFELTKPDGTKQSMRVGLHLLVNDVASRLPRFTVPPGRDYGQTILLSELLSFPQAGAYTLRVRFDGSIAGTSDSSSALPRKSTFSIVVLPRDEARLNERLRELSSRLALPQGSDGFSEAVDELSSIKDPVAIPYLEAATDREISPKFCETLRLIGTPAAKQALERLSAHRTAWIAQAAKNARSRMK